MDPAAIRWPPRCWRNCAVSRPRQPLPSPRGQRASTFFAGSDQYNVYIELQQSSTDALRDVFLSGSAQGAFVPLRSLINIKAAAGPNVRAESRRSIRSDAPLPVAGLSRTNTKDFPGFHLHGCSRADEAPDGGGT